MGNRRQVHNMEYQFTLENFQKDALDSKVPVLVDFYANWCGPCRAMMPVVEDIANKYEGKLRVGKVNSDEQPELAQAFNVMSIPAFFILKNGKVVDQMVGAMPISELKGRIDAQL
ncbi:MAG: thioredoxin [Atopobiaceae bacterium]|nr:thioredoxin [Atopobiaceae bacterium]